MDTTTRYIVSSAYVEERSIANMFSILKKAKLKTEDQIKVVTTDGLQVYPRILRNTFNLHKHESKTKIIHNVVTGSEMGFNHKIERLHNSIRERTKTTRGFHGCFKSAYAIMKGYEIFYNFCRKHQAINKYPYELALPDLKLNENKWLDLIYIAKRQNI